MSNQLRHQQRTLYDWATENGWSELRFDERDMAWRGFAPSSHIEETLPEEALLEFAPTKFNVEYDRILDKLLVYQRGYLQAMLRENIPTDELSYNHHPVMIEKYLDLVASLDAGKYMLTLAVERLAVELAVTHGKIEYCKPLQYF